MQEEGYNGWKNYPTWAVNLWLANDEGLYHASLAIADEEIDDAINCLPVRDRIWSLEEARRFNTADHLREFVEELLARADEPQYGMAADLLGYALGCVDWNEIADAWIESAQEAREYA